jgi:hypothetical protein
MVAIWRKHADELAQTALEREFVRTDRYGGYYVNRETGETRKAAKPRDPVAGAMTEKILQWHFVGLRTENIVGAFYLTPNGPESAGKKVSVDIDDHAGEGLEERNETYAVHLCEKLKSKGFCPLTMTWGGGSYHVDVYFDALVPGTNLVAFGKWLVADSARYGFATPPEVFPKQSAVQPGAYGNWKRIFGRHHTRPVYAKVYDGKSWVEGADAIRFYLRLKPSSPTVIPAEALHRAEQKPPVKPSKNDHASVTKALMPTPAKGPEGDDVFDTFNKRTSLDEMCSWLARFGTETSRSATRVEFARNGKEGGQSFNVEVKNGVPLLWNFSSNAGLPTDTALTPSQLRCFLDLGSCDPATMNRFAAVLRGQLALPANEAEPKAPEFHFYDSSEFDSGDFAPQWLIKNCWVRGEPGVIGGPVKCLKTTLAVDFVISVASGKPFLEKWDVPNPTRTAIVSGESGRSTLQDTARRICKAKGFEFKTLDKMLHWSCDLPTLGDEDSMTAFAEALVGRGIEFVVIDPFYLSLGGGVDEKSIMKMGPVLKSVVAELLNRKIDVAIIHHANRQLERDRPGEPMELHNLAFTGLDAFTRQWMLLSRRRPYEGKGRHELWLNIGGSAGHGGQFGLTVNEGELADDFTGRVWEPSVVSASEIKTLAAEERDVRQQEQRLAKRRKDDAAVLATVDALVAETKRATQNAIRTRAGFSGYRVKEALERLLVEGVLRSSEAMVVIGSGAAKKATVYHRVPPKGVQCEQDP